MQPRPPSASSSVLTRWMGPGDANIAGKPTAVPPLRPGTPVEQRRAREAQLRRDHRLAERERIEAARGEEAAATPPSG